MCLPEGVHAWTAGFRIVGARTFSSLSTMIASGRFSLSFPISFSAASRLGVRGAVGVEGSVFPSTSGAFAFPFSNGVVGVPGLDFSSLLRLSSRAFALSVGDASNSLELSPATPIPVLWLATQCRTAEW